MPSDKPRPSLADYVTIVASPALIITMIVSLVFFLLAVLYRGEFAERLHAVLFFFIFGIVLVARIAMAAGYGPRAPVYGGVLAVLAWIGMTNFVAYPAEAVATGLVNAVLIGTSWWLSHQLTYSCTYIDERAENTGAGVLQAAGLEKGQSPATPAAAEQPDGQIDKHRKAPKPGWWERYRRFRERRRQTQPPGVWLVYFALAALPIFGLGQALIDVADSERRAYSFRLMALYLASSLALLVTTAFLGLRRYLRQRRIEMPKTVTAAWLILGGVLLVSFVSGGAVLPRPRSEFSLLNIRAIANSEHSASKLAVTSGEPGKGKGRPGAQKEDPDGKPTSTNKGKGSAGKEAKGKGASAADSKAEKTNKSEGTAKKSGETAETQKKDANGQAKESEPGAEPAEQSPATEPSAGTSFLQSFLENLSKLMKWIVFGVLIAITLFFVLTGGLKYLANFTDWARRLLEALRRFWEGLFGQRRRGAALESAAAQNSAVAQASFSSFANPFSDGRAAHMPPAALIRYSFEALEAWAGEVACARAAQETPIEFTKRMADEVGGFDEETKELGTVYACVLYAHEGLPPTWRKTLEQFWERIALA